MELQLPACHRSNFMRNLLPKLKNSRLLWILTAFSLVLIANIKVTFAQMMVNPMVIETEAQKGQARGFLTVTNNGAGVMRARIIAQPFDYGKKGFEVLASSPTDLSPYLVFSPREFVLQPGQTRQIRLSTKLPPSLKDQELRAVLFIENLAATEQVINQNTGSSQNAVVPRLGVTVYVRQGKAEPQLQVDSATVAASNIRMIVKNTGNASARPEILWTVIDKKGTTISGKVDAITVIAGGDREIILIEKLPPTLTPGNYELKGELRWTREKEVRTQTFTTQLTIPSR